MTQTYMTTLAAAMFAAGVTVLAVPAQAQSAQASGEVVRVNAQAGKIAIRHGAISDLDLPAMTLMYHIDPALLKGIKAGDHVKFRAERAQDEYRITELKK